MVGLGWGGGGGGCPTGVVLKPRPVQNCLFNGKLTGGGGGEGTTVIGVRNGIKTKELTKRIEGINFKSMKREEMEI